MDKYNYALDVNCDFCHAKNKAGTELAFESDAKPEKSITRKIIRMGKCNRGIVINKTQQRMH